MKHTIYSVLVGSPPPYALERAAASLRRAAPADYEAFIDALHSNARDVAARVMGAPPQADSAMDAYNKGAAHAILDMANRMREAEDTLRAYEGTQAAPNQNKPRF